MGLQGVTGQGESRCDISHSCTASKLHVADWTTRGLADAAKRTKTKHAVAGGIRELSSNRMKDAQTDGIAMTFTALACSVAR